MKAWVIDGVSDLSRENSPLKLVDLPRPEPSEGELLIKVSACGVCHTELDEIEGRTPPSVYPVVPGHQVIGTVEECGENVSGIKIGDRVGVAWIYSACGKCDFCLSGNENLCSGFRATGRDVNGGYAGFMTVPRKYAYPVPGFFSDIEAAPLLCAGAIGFRSLRLSGITNGKSIGLTGFGASAHLVLKLIRHQFPGSTVCVFARNPSEREFALHLGADWAGDTGDKPPVLLNSIIDTTPVWNTVIHALGYLKPGGRLVINAIRKESTDVGLMAGIDYPKHLWMEKEIKSVANVTSDDVRSFIEVAEEMSLKPEVEVYDFIDANKAVTDIKQRNIKGAKVLVI